MGDLDWVADTIKAAGVDVSDYTVDPAADNALDDIPGIAIVETSAALTGKSATDGVADCDDITLETVTGDEIGALVFYKDTGTPATSILIAYVEAGPVTPNGTDIVFEVSDGADKLFKL